MIFLKNIKNYIIIASIVLLLASVTVLKIQNNSLNKRVEKQIVEIELLKNNTLSLKTSIQKQNAEIEKQKLEVKKYLEDYNRVNKELENLYKDIKIDTSSCEAQLGSIDALLEQFSKNKQNASSSKK